MYPNSPVDRSLSPTASVSPVEVLALQALLLIASVCRGRELQLF